MVGRKKPASGWWLKGPRQLHPCTHTHRLVGCLASINPSPPWELKPPRGDTAYPARQRFGLRVPVFQGQTIGGGNGRGSGAWATCW